MIQLQFRTVNKNISKARRERARRDWARRVCILRYCIDSTGDFEKTVLLGKTNSEETRDEKIIRTVKVWISIYIGLKIKVKRSTRDNIIFYLIFYGAKIFPI
jgi:hypothetical protein